MKTVPVAEVEAHLGAYLDELAGQPVIITRDGAPIAALVPIEDDEEAERLSLAYNVELKQLLEEAAERIARGGGIPHDEFWKAVDAMYQDGENESPSSAS